MSQRRYTEKEIASIFKQASEAQEAAQRQLQQSEGLTLEEIAAIGKEAGITPEFIAQAAANVDRKVEKQPAETYLGIPYSTSRTIDIPGSFTDDDWTQLVTKLHDTFQVHGNITQQGATRKWQAEGIKVLVEPAGEGYRARLSALNEQHRGILVGATVMFVMGLFFLAIVASKGDLLTAKAMFVSMFSIVGMGAFGGSSLKLSKWRREQEAKMDAIGLHLGSIKMNPSLEAIDNQSSKNTLDLDLPDEDPSVLDVGHKTRVR